MDKGESHILKYIRHQIDVSVFKTQDQYEISEWYKAFGNWIVKWTSLAYMAYSVNTQVFNLGIGHMQDIVYEGEAYKKGIARLGTRDEMVPKTRNYAKLQEGKKYP
jgi:hypothetical protein